MESVSFVLNFLSNFVYHILSNHVFFAGVFVSRIHNLGLCVIITNRSQSCTVNFHGHIQRIMSEICSVVSETQLAARHVCATRTRVLHLMHVKEVVFAELQLLSGNLQGETEVFGNRPSSCHFVQKPTMEYRGTELGLSR